MMSNEKIKWHSVSNYVDLSTGQKVDKCEINVSFKIKEVIEKSVKTSKDGYTKTLTRLISVTPVDAIQKTLWK